MPMYGQSLGQTVKWDSKSLLFDGKRVVPVMGEIHYSRIPENEWRQELQKMKTGGVTMIANYVFWNHVEEKKEFLIGVNNVRCGIFWNCVRMRTCL